MTENGERPWGRYDILGESPSYKVKTITVDLGQRLSYQRHAHRAEHWFIVTGTGVVTLDGAERPVGPGQAVDVPVRGLHRIANTGDTPLTFIEVQHGESFAEDDIERLEDDYSR